MQAGRDGETPRAPSGAAISLRGISKTYGSVTAIAGLDLEIRAGEFITLLGPSGSGKSTTLMMVAGFDAPTTGEILIDARPVTRTPPHRRNLGMVFQNYALFPHLTVGENIAFPLRQRGVDKAEARQRVARMLELVKLSGLEGRYPRQLSGGQQQRVAIARAIVFNPPVLLMDEPLSALDKQLREELVLEIKRLHERLGITFVFVTHDQREALVMSDRVAVMNHGRIEQIEAPGALYDAPCNRFVASFIGEANLLEADPVGAAPDGSARLRLGPTEIRAAAAGANGSRLCMVRPEKISVQRQASGHPDANALPVTVRETVFMGEMVRYLVQAAHGPTLTVKQQHRAGMPVFVAAEPAVIEWAVADTRII
ncbi:MAG TPA: ABC transporter ATP-binding protein [Acetobacteraceae bacterium]|nr:ABC transporter ATP-binding protein [Acetobacteraceae bacterium]